MNDLKYKSLAFAVKAMGDEGPGTFELYAAVFGNVDRQGEVLQAGAFTNLEAFVKDGWGAINHDNWGSDLGVATVDEATQDSVGLKVRGTFHSTPDAQACRTKIRERMERGKSVPCSFGYRVVDGAVEVRDGEPVCVLKRVEVYEFSFVNLPANPSAGVTAVKGLAGPPRLSEVKEMIDGLKSGRTMSKAMHKYLKGVHDGLAPAVADLKSLIDRHDPAVPDGGPDDDAGAKAHALRLRSLKIRAGARA